MNWQTVVAFLQANWQTVVAFLQALLTPTIALLTVVIAVAQYRLAKAQFRHELYERRSAVFKATMKFIAQVTSGGMRSLMSYRPFCEIPPRPRSYSKSVRSKYNRSSILSTSEV